MTSSIRDRLEEAIREESERSLERLRISREGDTDVNREFEPVRQAAEEIREELQHLPSIEFTVNPGSVWITLADRSLWFGYDRQERHFVGEESAHSWHDGELHADRYKWDTAETCVAAMIRLCARYARMARNTASTTA